MFTKILSTGLIANRCIYILQNAISLHHWKKYSFCFICCQIYDMHIFKRIEFSNTFSKSFFHFIYLFTKIANQQMLFKFTYLWIQIAEFAFLWMLRAVKLFRNIGPFNSYHLFQQTISIHINIQFHKRKHESWSSSILTLALTLLTSSIYWKTLSSFNLTSWLSKTNSVFLQL